jgi:hypothetical protein
MASLGGQADASEPLWQEQGSQDRRCFSRQASDVLGLESLHCFQVLQRARPDIEVTSKIEAYGLLPIQCITGLIKLENRLGGSATAALPEHHWWLRPKRCVPM